MPSLIQQFDEQLSHWLHAHGTPTLDWLMLRATYFGNTQTMYLAAFVLAIFFALYRRRKREATLIISVTATSFVLNMWLKRIVQRPRPQLIPDTERLIALPGDYSFPSGHAMISLTLYGLATAFLAQTFPKFRNLIYGLGSLLIFLIGASRAYLGVHWPTDILAGFVFGGLFVFIGLRSQRAIADRKDMIIRR